MSIWKILQIEKTNDKKAIKNAYRTQLKLTHPEEKPEEFMKLREAYEEALEYAETVCEFEELEDDAYDSEEGCLAKENSQEVRECFIQRTVDNWWHKVRVLWEEFERRCDIEEWKKLLYDDIPYKITYYDKCRQRIYGFLFEDKSEACYLPGEIWKLLDNFFNFSPNELEYFSFYLRMENKKLKLSEMVDFTKVIVNEEWDVDGFFEAYERMYRLMPYIENENNQEEVNGIRKKLDRYKVTYLPYECMKLALHFEDMEAKAIDEQIEVLSQLFGETDDVKLLKVQYMIFKGELKEAKEQLHQLYNTVSLKNYPMIYQMAICCEQVSMNFEAYMLNKQLSWLHPEDFIEKNAERIYETMEAEYQKKVEGGEEISDLERIQMCRMYLRSNREKDALQIINEVTDPAIDSWNYHVARVLSYFNEYDIEPMQSSWEKLDEYDKQKLNPIEQLEWEELKARYLFEQKKYAECIDKCNELLEEYPISFTILTLRGYADYCMTKKDKVYFDFYYLKSVAPKRVEVLLMMAQFACDSGKESLICELLEEVKDKCFEQYEYGRIKRNYNCYSDECKKEWIKLFTRIKKQEVNIPAESKYGCIDLNLLFRIASLSLYKKYDEKIHKKLKSLLISLKNSDYNHPEKYMNLTIMHYYTEDYRKAIKSGLEWLKNAKDDFDKIWCYEILLRCYGDIGDIKGLEKLWIDTENLMLSMDGYADYCRMYSGAFGAYTGVLGKYDETLYKRVEDIGLKLKEMARSASDYYTIHLFYKKWGDVTGDVSRYQKAIDIWKECLSIFGKIGDVHGECQSIYLIMARLYARAGMKQEALIAVEDMRRYARNEEVINESYMYIAEVFEELEEFELADEYYIKAEEHGSWIISKVLRYYLKAGKYRQAYNIFMRDPDAIDGVYAMHAKYMEEGKFDILQLEGVKENLLEEVSKEDISADEVGDCYACLMDVCSALGDEEQEEYYRKKALEHKWDSHLDKDDCILRSELWILWYKKQYKKAWELLCENRHCLVLGNIEVMMFNYILGKMFK